MALDPFFSGRAPRPGSRRRVRGCPRRRCAVSPRADHPCWGDAHVIRDSRASSRSSGGGGRKESRTTRPVRSSSAIAYEGKMPSARVSASTPLLTPSTLPITCRRGPGTPSLSEETFDERVEVAIRIAQQYGEARQLAPARGRSSCEADQGIHVGAEHDERHVGRDNASIGIRRRAGRPMIGRRPLDSRSPTAIPRRRRRRPGLVGCQDTSIRRRRTACSANGRASAPARQVARTCSQTRWPRFRPSHVRCSSQRQSRHASLRRPRAQAGKKLGVETRSNRQDSGCDGRPGSVDCVSPRQSSPTEVSSCQSIRKLLRSSTSWRIWACRSAAIRPICGP